MENVKVCVAIPTYGGVCPDFLLSMLILGTNQPCKLDIKFRAGDSLVSRSRNVLTHEFLKTDCTHLLFVDSDLVFNPGHIIQLISRDKDVIGGFYPKKQQGELEWVYNKMTGASPLLDDSRLKEVRYMGTGFLLIKRIVFEKMTERYGEQIWYLTEPHPERPQEKQYDFWSVGPYTYPDGSRRFLSEDWFFCERWREMGGQVWGDGLVVLQHVGPVAFPLKTQLPEMQVPAKALSPVMGT